MEHSRAVWPGAGLVAASAAGLEALPSVFTDTGSASAGATVASEVKAMSNGATGAPALGLLCASRASAESPCPGEVA